MTARQWIDGLELVALFLLHLALFPLALISWIVFAALAVDAGIDPGPVDPLFERATTLVGYLLWAAPFVLISGSAWTVVWILHALVVKPLDPSRDRPRSS